MLRLTICFILSVALFGCNNDPDVIDPIDPIDSPFQDFFGVWELESSKYNGVAMSPNPIEFMSIEEDDDHTDAFATGYYEEGSPIERFELSLELTDNENEMILRKRNVTFTCDYLVLDADRFTLTDYWDDDSSTVVNTWKR